MDVKFGETGIDITLQLHHEICVAHEAYSEEAIEALRNGSNSNNWTLIKSLDSSRDDRDRERGLHLPNMDAYKRFTQMLIDFALKTPEITREMAQDSVGANALHDILMRQELGEVASAMVTQLVLEADYHGPVEQPSVTPDNVTTTEESQEITPPPTT